MQIDPDFAAIAADPRNTSRPPPAHVTLETFRSVANAAMADPAPPDCTDISDHTATGDEADVRFRLYRPDGSTPLPVVVFCHGGGFVLGDLETHDGLCRRLCLSSGLAVVSVEYRLAPETRFPGAARDVLTVLRFLADSGPSLSLDMSRMALAGDSAGGNIAITATDMVIRVGMAPRHLALIYPVVDPDCSTDSHVRMASGPILSSEGMRWFWSCYLGSTPPKTNMIFAPLRAELSHFPPTTIVTAEFDPLRDEGIALARHLGTTGIAVHVSELPGTVHGYLSLAPDVAASRKTIQAVAAQLSAAMR